MVEPVLEHLVAAADTDEQPAEVDHLVLLLALFEVGQDWFGERTDHQGEYLLKGNHNLLLLLNRWLTMKQIKQ